MTTTMERGQGALISQKLRCVRTHSRTAQRFAIAAGWRRAARGPRSCWQLVPTLAALLLTGAMAPFIGGVQAVQAQEDHLNRAPKGTVWLVTKDGQRIAASAPWEVQGPRLLYRNLAGDLVSVRKSEIDLEASDRLNNPAPVVPKSAPPKEPVLVLRSNEQPELAAQPASDAGEPDAATAPDSTPTTSGSAQNGPEANGPQAGADDSAAGDAEASTEASVKRSQRASQGTSRGDTGVAVASWRNLSPDPDVATIYGTLENTGPRAARGITVVVVVTDEAGGEVARRPGSPLSTQLGPGETTNFRAVLENLGPHADFRFEVTADP